MQLPVGYGRPPILSANQLYNVRERYNQTFQHSGRTLTYPELAEWVFEIYGTRITPDALRRLLKLPTHRKRSENR